MPPGLGRLSSLSSNHSTPDGTAPASQRHAVVFPVPTLLTSTKAPRQEEALKALRRPSASPAWKVEDSAALQLREELRGISRQLELGSRQDWCALKRRLFLLIAEVERQMVQPQDAQGFSRDLTPSPSPGALRSAVEVRDEDVDGPLADVSFARPGALALRPQDAPNSLCSDSSRSGSKPRVLVLGSSYLRSEVLQELSKGWEVQGLCSSPPIGPVWSLLDMGLAELQSHLQRFQPQAVVNCHTSAALLELESESSESPLEKDARSREVLAFLASLATACAARQIFLLHLSSDAVFGKAPDGAQSVDAEPKPCTPLGWRTLAAEQEVLSCSRAAAVLRLPLLWDGPNGPVQTLEESATRLLSELRRGVREFEDWQRCYPTRAVEVASIVANLLQLTCMGPVEQRPRGIYHWQGSDQVTEFQMAEFVAEVSGMKVFLQPAPHPSKLWKSCCLDCSRTARTVRVPRTIPIIASLRLCLPATQQEQHV
ncbi:Methionine adenosyltransferase 2 subunit beta [Symbiodinium microadriaticum]|uniref:Methionine adenosyltransferase 2 subunit beta n=1 Tax=Symbiodinium microadriaticum TaxID=2951 RepID=A0A1Q9CWF2_SYMMI|nr:Methionine adenosyltransferase 2 subunit beta [Symbiodinium microadriaticum]